MSYKFRSRIIKNLSRERDANEEKLTLPDGRWPCVSSEVQKPI